MHKFLLSCLSIFILCNFAYSQTYVFDKNLKLENNIAKELVFVNQHKVYSADEVISEFMANEIRATNIFKDIIILKGRISKILKVGDKNYLALQVSDDDFAKNHLYVYVQNTALYKNVHSFDKITNYSVGDWVNIVSSYLLKTDAVSYNYLFIGNILHTKSIYAKKNFLIKIVNLPSDSKISYSGEDNEYAQKFSDVSNGKSFCKFTSAYEKTSIVVEIKDLNNFLLKKVKLTGKINCISTFDYNKL